MQIEDTLQNIKGKTVLVVDDCLTSGKTINAVYNLLANKGATSIYIAVLYKNIHTEYPIQFAA